MKWALLPSKNVKSKEHNSVTMCWKCPPLAAVHVFLFHVLLLGVLFLQRCFKCTAEKCIFVSVVICVCVGGLFLYALSWKTLEDRNWVVLSLEVEGPQAWRNTLDIAKLCRCQNYVDYNLFNWNTLNISGWELQNLGGGGATKASKRYKLTGCNL